MRPLFTLLVGPHDYRPLDLRPNPGRNGRRRMFGPSGNRIDLAELIDPVQVRVDGHEAIDSIADEPGEDAGSDDFTGLESCILTHIRQIGRDHQDATRSEHACRTCTVDQRQYL